MSLRDTATRAYSVTPNDNTNLPNGPAYLTCLVSGNAVVIPHEPIGSVATAVTVYLTAGLVFPLMVDRVKSTSTTATGIVALYCKG